MHAIAAAPGARRLFAVSIIARLPLAMFGVGLLVHAAHLTGSFAQAGLVAGANAIALGAGAPLLGRLVDRRGQTLVLICGAGVAAAALGTAAALPSGAPLAVLVGLAALVGLATPPLGACVRTLLPVLLRDADAARAAYAVESAVLELTWISGPPLVLALGALWSTGAALAAAGALLLVGACLFAAQPVSRTWRPAPDRRRPRGGSLRTPALRTLMFALVAAGGLLGAVEVAVTATAEELGSTAIAGPLLGAWGVGSFAGGVLAARAGGGARTAAGLAWLLTGLAAGHLALAAATDSAIALAAVLIVAGAAIAPMFATVYGMVDAAAPAGTATEAFAWLSTAIAIGASAGAAGAGAVTDAAGPALAFALAAGSGAAGALVTALCARTLTAARERSGGAVAQALPESAPA